MITAAWTPTKDDVRLAARAARRSAPLVVRFSAQLMAAVLLVAGAVLSRLGFSAGSLFGGGLGVLLAAAVLGQFVLVGHRDPRGFVPYVPKRALADPAAARALIAGRLEVR